MRRKLYVCVSLVVIFGCSMAYSDDDVAGTPFKYISSCEIDLDGDDILDIAQLIETIRGRELIVLIKDSSGYDAFLIDDKVSEKMYLSCHFGHTIKTTTAGSGDPKEEIINTPGAYLKLYYPEGPSYGYYWNGKGFSEAWLSD